MVKTSCPVCGGDWANPAVLRKIEKNVFLCRECDSMWWGDEDIKPESAKDISVVLEDLNLPPTTDEIYFLTDTEVEKLP